jgi:hypothetical protein
MWQVGRIELILPLMVLAFFISRFGMAQNQTLRINVELPAGVELRSMTGVESGSGNELWSDIYGKNYAMIAEDGSLLPLRWIMIQTYENSQFLLEIKNQDVPGKQTFIYFLNDNTNNLQSAQSLKEFPALLNFNQKGLLIRNFKPRRTTFKAWLGYYGENQLESLLLEYF